ncbi:UNVERIFIED_CONTAM: hypothetical protein PYX00_002214 [Menopon gallinae]|uniref:Uncharacterized protein n=1 Tax=Menopon gallinae TaxID=328185 RepID=A0AAW2IHH8_9NEOP
MDGGLNYNCRLALTPQQPTTSTRIGLAYRSPYYFSYGKQQLGRIPNIEVTKPFAGDEIYSTTYNDTFIRPSVEKDNTNMLKKCRRGLQTEFPKLIKPFPTRLQETEYRNQYLEKPLPMTVKGSNIEKLSTCPQLIVDNFNWKR